MSGSIAFALTDLSRSHKLVLAELVALNPSVSLAIIAESANATSSLATCPITITPDLLKELGYREPKLSEQPSTRPATLTPRTIRTQLEERHNKIQVRIEGLLDDDTINEKKAKVFQMLAQIDDKLITQLLELMNEEAAPLLPMAIIVLCLRQQGVPEDDIIFIQEL